MSNIRDAAKNYVSKQTKNVAELKSVPVDMVLFDGIGKDKDEKEFKYQFVEVDGMEYRIPDQVLRDLKAILDKKPTLKNFSVTRQGEGLKTRYTVIPLD